MTMISTFPTSVTLALNGTTTSAASLGGRSLVGIRLPADFDGTAITFTECDTLAGTYVAVYDVGGASAYSVTVGTSRYVPVNPRVFDGIVYLKLVSGTAQDPATTITLVTR